jgi:hydrogenase nickel incorporation protein HypA/HybF
MHELSVTEEIFKIVLKHARKNKMRKVTVVRLEIGALSDLAEQWIQRYFDKISKGSIAEGARISVSRKQCVFVCTRCSTEFPVDLAKDAVTSCPGCGGTPIRMVSGNEYCVFNMEGI